MEQKRRLQETEEGGNETRMPETGDEVATSTCWPAPKTRRWHDLGATHGGKLLSPCTWTGGNTAAAWRQLLTELRTLARQFHGLQAL
mgnify:FL=1